ncbi:MAG: hypothetical protein IT536_02885 [Hyphomicrobiales bacterium]|nr:hypothetical protein [Hyphomicrobiales bacterium]
MRKIALMLTAALLVSAPVLTTGTSESLAAAKAKSKAESAPQNPSFFGALGDNLAGKSVAAKKDKAAKGGMGGMRGKAKKGKGGMGGMGGKAAKGGMAGGMGGDGGMGGKKK